MRGLLTLLLLEIFFSVCEWTRIYCGWRPNLPDEGDNHLVELAVAECRKAGDVLAYLFGNYPS
jgi:hypothetical protein